MPATMTFAFQGTAAQFQSSLKGLGLLLVIAVMVIYLVLGMLYESFIHPITILSGLPSAAIGALLTLLLFGEDLNLYSFLGIILLIGIVKKNAIMIVDFALDAERTTRHATGGGDLPGLPATLSSHHDDHDGGAAGALPIAFGSGAGGEARRPLGIAVVGGLLALPIVDSLRHAGHLSLPPSLSTKARQHGSRREARRARPRCSDPNLTECLKLVGSGAGRLSIRNPLVFGSGFPLGFGFSTPLFRICVMHLLHLLRDVRMILCYVLNHQADHFIPRFR